MENQEMKVRLSDIRPGRNPRRYFDPLQMTELESSIRAQGLLQPILLRPAAETGKFEIVAGERRFRAAKVVYGDAGEIPVLVRELSDAEVDAAALAENMERADMTPVEEAEAAARVLGNCKGNREEAAARLGWTRPTLDKRLALMYATEKVRAALQDKKILLGHAELLAVMRTEAQDNAIDLLLKQPKLMAVAELKATIDKEALILDQAIFDKGDCAACIHNTGNQSALFTEAISDGRCSNKECFDLKTEAELQARVTGLKDEYQVVRIARPGENHTVIPLVAEGPKGVGAEQASACRLCKNFGAVVSGVPNKLGQVFKNLCLDVPCNVTKVAARVNAEKAAAKEAASKAAAPKPEGSNTATDTPASGASQKPAEQGKTAARKPPEKLEYPEPSNRVKEYRETLWRAIFKRVVAKLTVPQNRMVLLALCLTSPGKISSSELCKDLDAMIKVGSLAQMGTVLQNLLDLDQAKLGLALQSIAANVSSGPMGLDIKDIVAVLKTFEVNIADHWKVGSEFFTLLTKNEIDAVCGELGISAAMGGEYAKARNLGKEEYIKAILAVKDFDYRGRIPKLVTW